MKKTTRQVLALCLLAGSGALPALACGGGEPKPAETASAPSDTAPTASPLASAPADSSSAAPADSTAATPDNSPLAQVLETDSGNISKIFDAANSAPAATMKANGSTGTDPLAKGVRDAAKRLPAGMQADGPMAMGTLKEKGHLAADFTLAPGKCYSIVGFSKKVKDLDLYLLLPPGILSGQDLTDDNKPVIGGPPQPMCPVSTTAVTYKVDIFADQGSGDVAVQLYSKGK